MPPSTDRKLTDADVQEIVSQIEIRVSERFYKDLGRGVWGIAWKAILIAMISIAAYGSVKGIK